MSNIKMDFSIRQRISACVNGERAENKPIPIKNLKLYFKGVRQIEKMC